jgi:drug/metabolite transporter (DMT)-like permease
MRVGIRYWRGLAPSVLAQGQMIAASVLLVPMVLLAGRQPVDLDGSILAATAMLGFVGTGLAYVINYAIVARDGATVASTVTYLLPVVAVVLGAAVLDETIGCSPTRPRLRPERSSAKTAH